MVAIRIESTAAPWAEREVALEASTFLGRAEAMGLLDSLEGPITRIDAQTMGTVFNLLRDRGLFPRFLNPALSPLDGPAGTKGAGRGRGETVALLDALRQANAALEDSASPADEWRHLRDICGEGLLARLCVISSASLRRYSSGARTTPDDVAARLHTVALVVADLSGAYNNFGIRRWFVRPRTLLSGRSPSGVLRGSWSPDDPEVVRIRELARAITASPAS